MASRRFDFPDAFGPATNTRCCSDTSTEVKLRQFSKVKSKYSHFVSTQKLKNLILGSVYYGNR